MDLPSPPPATAGVLLAIVGTVPHRPGSGRADRQGLLRGHRRSSIRFNVTTWGYLLHLIVVLIFALFAGFSLFTGNVLARTAAVIIAVLSAVASFMSLPYYPSWSTLIIAFDVLVIWALTAHGRDVVTD